MKDRKQKAPKLSATARKKIRAYSDKNPDYSMRELADIFGVTERQVRSALDEVDEFSKKGSNQKEITAEAKRILKSGKTGDEIFKEQFELLAALLEADEELPPLVRFRMLKDLANTRRFIHQIEMVHHMRRADAGIIMQIIQRFQPDATEEDCIKIYKEEVAKWNASHA